MKTCGWLLLYDVQDDDKWSYSTGYCISLLMMIISLKPIGRCRLDDFVCPHNQDLPLPIKTECLKAYY